MNTSYHCISADFRADFGMLKKSDINDGISLTYNMLHRPALLGILGAIIGLGGYTQAKEASDSQPKPKRGEKRPLLLPAYYTLLKHIRLAIQPLAPDGSMGEFRGTFQKTVVEFNNAVGYANTDGGTLQIREQTLIKPAYRVYLLLNDENEHEKKLLEYLREYRCEFIPYFGKNDCGLWWENVQQYEVQHWSNMVTIPETFQLSSLFVRRENTTVKKMRYDDTADEFASDDHEQLNPEPASNDFFLLETLPRAYDETTGHYSFHTVVFTNSQLQVAETTKPRHLATLRPISSPIQKNSDESVIVQFF